MNGSVQNNNYPTSDRSDKKLQPTVKQSERICEYYNLEPKLWKKSTRRELIKIIENVSAPFA